MSEVENYIGQFKGRQKSILLFLHDLLTNEFGLRDKISYKIPFYYQKSWICYLNPQKNGNVEFAFIRGNELSNEQGLLQSKGRKMVSGIEFSDIGEIPLRELKEIINEALILDEEVKYQFKKKE